ncbi:glycosyltransferase [Guptibacillus hwajinpoensis]|uniref:glycosyltransferase n=1 Tax=Guptibacillus hwajinpoensis TaxID=208199 RepID=UPI001CD73BAC|nr:glycosyltransferase [Pseudalkalibacillus hwajinpoensis]MCA0991601.1 glycosyltransferase [Pseudalkalibacillus hwajinpoensis]
MHVLIVPSGYPMEGKPYRGVFYKEQAMALSRAGYQVTVAFPEIWSLKSFNKNVLKGSRSKEVEDGVLTYRYKGYNYFANAPYSTEMIYKKRLRAMYKDIVKEVGVPDVIHAHSCLWGGFGAAAISRDENIPLIITEHSSAFGRNMLKPYQKKLAQKAFSQADRLLAVGPGLKRDMVSYTTQQVDIVPNFIDMSDARPKKNRESKEPFRLLAVANLNANKGLDLLIHAFHHAFPHGDTELRIGGMGEEKDKLQRLINELDLESRVTLIGTLSREQVKKEMQLADVFVSSSYYETFGVVLVEALSVGTPIIATDSGGPSMIVNELNGILVPTGEIHQLSQALIYMSQHYKKYDPNLIHEDCKERFGEEAVISMLTNIYSKLVQAESR